MPPQSRGRLTALSYTRSAPDLLPLASFSITPASTPEEGTPRALSGLQHPPHASLSDDEDEDEDSAADEADFHSHYSLDAPSGSDSADSESGSDEGQDDTINPQRPFLRHSNSSFLSANAFAPPFYNKPPTPLPPSPSLTSLLRPSFSATTSRPTTPDSSENDTPNDTEAAVAKSARTATTVPRASPKVPTYEYYGFVLYLMSSSAFAVYLLWSYLPSHFLHQLGIQYYPNRWWSLAVPSFLVMTLVYIYVALAAYNTEYLTLPMDSIENIVDEAANIATVDRQRSIRRGSSGAIEGDRTNWVSLWDEGTDAVMDIPVGGFTTGGFTRLLKPAIVLCSDRATPFGMATPTDPSLHLVRQSQGYVILNMTVVVAILVALAVILRSLARWKSKASFAIDDYFIFGSLTSSEIIFRAPELTTVVVRKGGLGRDTALSDREWNVFLKVFPSTPIFTRTLMASQITYSLTITCSKMSILLLYRRIFAVRRFQQATLIVGSVCLGWCVAAIWADILQCRQTNAAFDPDKFFTSQCINLQAYYRGITASNMVLDVMVLSMPLCMVWRLKLDTKQKISLSGIFLLGGLVCVASLMRLLTTSDLQAKDFPSLENPNTSSAESDVAELVDRESGKESKRPTVTVTHVDLNSSMACRRLWAPQLFSRKRTSQLSSLGNPCRKSPANYASLAETAQVVKEVPVAITPNSHLHAMQAIKRHFQSSGVATSVRILDVLREHYPDHIVVQTPRDKGIFRLAKAGLAHATLDIDSGLYGMRTYKRAEEDGNPVGHMKDKIELARFDYQWNGHHFKVYEVYYYEYGQNEVDNHYILCPKDKADIIQGRSKIIDELITAAALHENFIDDEIWVYDKGYWRKNRKLWKSVQACRWDQVILDPEMKTNLVADVEGFFDRKEDYKSFGVPWKRGIILHGLPGNGKTISIKALMHSLSCRSPQIPTLYVKSLGRSVDQDDIREIFDKARETAPCLLVFEDIDSLVSKLARNTSLRLPPETSSTIASITEGFSFAYLQEALITALLGLVQTQRLDSSQTSSLATPPGSIEATRIFQEIQKQVMVLRKEMQSSRKSVEDSGKNSMLSDPRSASASSAGFGLGR
ncbi:MAG: hypothetical protein Q9166_007877 [cf. Caloplaca sp. 2 TL-2023]